MSRVLPILFNTEMVQAILDDRKTTTRRLVRFLPGKNPNWTGYVKDGLMLYNGKNEPCCRKPQYAVGDILYVRETWSFISCIECTGSDGCAKTPSHYEDKESESIGCYIYRSGFPEYADHKRITWRPSIHMPKDAARIWLKVTDVLVERLQDIKGEDDYNYIVEGADDKHDFIRIWDSTVKDKEHEWSANPWVWVIEFERCEKPEEQQTVIKGST